MPLIKIFTLNMSSILYTLIISLCEIIILLIKRREKEKYEIGGGGTLTCRVRSARQHWRWRSEWSPHTGAGNFMPPAHRLRPRGSFKILGAKSRLTLKSNLSHIYSSHIFFISFFYVLSCKIVMETCNFFFLSLFWIGAIDLEPTRKKKGHRELENNSRPIIRARVIVHDKFNMSS